MSNLTNSSLFFHKSFANFGFMAVEYKSTSLQLSNNFPVTSSTSFETLRYICVCAPSSHVYQQMNTLNIYKVFSALKNIKWE